MATKGKRGKKTQPRHPEKKWGPFSGNQADSALAARVILLSATPYRMYTMSHEGGDDDHYGDLRKTLDFLIRRSPSGKSASAIYNGFERNCFTASIEVQSECWR